MKSVRVVFGSILICLVLLCATGAASAQVLNVSPQSLAFTYQLTGANPASQVLTVYSNGPASFAVTVSGAPWLTVSPTSGTTPTSLIVTATPPQGATPGTLSGNILIGPPASADNLKLVVPVTLQILAAPQGSLVVTPGSVEFNYAVGAPIPPAQSFTVTSTGSPASFILAVSKPWINLQPSSTTTPATVYVTLLPPANIAPGTYNETITVAPTYAGGTDQIVKVTVRVNGSGNLVVTPSYLTFNSQTGGGIQPQYLNVVNSTGGAVAFSVTASTGTGGAWLSFSPATGVTPYSVVVSVNPGGLGPGTYSGLITIAPTSSGGGPTQIPVTLNVYSTGQLVVDPSALTFNYQGGGPLPATQYLSVRSTGSPINYTVSVQGLSWVTVTSSGGTTPNGFGVNVSPPSNSSPGTYVANVIVTPAGGGGTSVTVPISTYVTSANYLTVGRSSVSFEYTTGGVNPPPVVVPVTSSSGSLQFQAVAATSGFGSWLFVSQSGSYTPANLTISVNPQGLAPGTYTGSVVVTAQGASNGQQTIAVTLVVSNTTTLVASPFGLVFSYQMGAATSTPQLFTVNSVGGSATFSVSTSTTTGGFWLTAVGGGTTPSTVVAGVNPGALGPGTYTGKILVTATDSTIPVLQMPVVLNVSPGPVFIPASNEVAFQWEIGNAAPASQQVTINTNNGYPGVFYPTVMTAAGGNWLAASPSIGTTPTSLVVTVNPVGLAAGLYYGLVALNDPAGDIPISFVPVTLQVTNGPVLTVPSQMLVFYAQPGAASPPQQQVTVGSTPPAPFHVSTYGVNYGGTWLVADPTDGLGNATINVKVIPDGLPNGYYLGGIVIEIPGVPNSQQLVPVVMIISPTA